jgi:arylsulfatase
VVKDPGAIRTQFCHVIDLAPTILELTAAPIPEQFNGIAQMPLHGTSISPTFTDGTAPAPRSRQYFEQFGHRGLWDDG